MGAWCRRTNDHAGEERADGELPLTDPPVLAIIGPTAVGKSQLAIELAELMGGEVVSVDSRCVYRFLDIGTAKPSPSDRARVRHHLIDMVNPDDEYSVARFLEDAGRVLDDLRTRGIPAVIAGGTGYWVRALQGGATSAAVPPAPELRRELEGLPAGELLERLRRLDPDAAETIDARNSRRLMRAIEVVHSTGRPYAAARSRTPRIAMRTIGLTLPRDLLYERIGARYDQMIEAGWVEEVRALLARGYRRDLPALSGLGYGELVAHLVDGLPLTEALERAKVRCRRYARSQYSWFRPDDPAIEWHDARSARADELRRTVCAS